MAGNLDQAIATSSAATSIAQVVEPDAKSSKPAPSISRPPVPAIVVAFDEPQGDQDVNWQSSRLGARAHEDSSVVVFDFATTAPPVKERNLPNLTLNGEQYLP
jgi:hypothetical protein